jgi:hypothetical protein
MDAGTLIFSKEGIPVVITLIQVVGTTSQVSKNWLWGWANESFPLRVTSRLGAVRDFGKAEGLPQLTESTWQDNEYLGWEMTAITARILGAKGAYRCPGSNGFIYFVYMSVRFATDADKLGRTASNKIQIDCDTHGRAFSTYVCEHLAANPRQQWFSEKPEESAPWPDAWCKQCDAVFQEDGNWNGKNEERIKIKILCHYCYESARKMQTEDGG